MQDTLAYALLPSNPLVVKWRTQTERCVTKETDMENCPRLSNRIF